ncbi:hypothetical protein VB716_01370 [Synechococcus sp. CCY9201]|uniref:hypothetical protein n=1 Tax=unclassified Synechococcus TaxID=2626047 RepID=UPI0018CDA92E|nr:MULTISPECIES: hypothetical protein [unclassified Synechococcus]MEA5472871.1 hypothetical protein [Synechococcus sp. CCY9201]QPN68021.1 hypothetical protein H8F26_08005 [Synechococcus sp. CBW1006]
MLLPSSRPAGLALVLAAILVPLARPGQAAPMGLGPVDSYPAAIQQTRKAAEAVLSHAGAESCLRGKLTNALLKLSASCSAAGRQGGACELADRAIVVTPWSVPFMESTSRALLDAAEAPVPSAP